MVKAIEYKVIYNSAENVIHVTADAMTSGVTLKTIVKEFVKRVDTDLDSRRFGAELWSEADNRFVGVHRRQFFADKSVLKLTNKPSKKFFCSVELLADDKRFDFEVEIKNVCKERQKYCHILKTLNAKCVQLFGKKFEDFKGRKLELFDKKMERFVRFRKKTFVESGSHVRADCKPKPKKSKDTAVSKPTSDEVLDISSLKRVFNNLSIDDINSSDEQIETSMKRLKLSSEDNQTIESSVESEIGLKLKDLTIDTKTKPKKKRKRNRRKSRKNMTKKESVN